MSLKYLLSVLLLVANIISQAQSNPFSKLNSEYDEQNPILDSDNQIIYFTRSNHPKNAGGESDAGDIWYSILGPTGWSSPVRAANINSYDYNGIIDVTKERLILHNHYATGSFLKTQGISIANKSQSGWSEPQNIRIPYFKNLGKYFGGSLSQDGKVLILSIESYGTVGAEDIYVCFKSDDKWSEPQNIGRLINTPYQEFTPHIYKDSLLYFSSNGHGGKGSADVFVSKRLDDTWLNWSTPENVEQINTEGRELGYRQYEGFAIYTSTINSDGYGDIKFYSPSNDQDTIFNQAIDTTVVVDINEVDVAELDENEILLYGEVTASNENEAFAPVVAVKTRGGKKIKAKLDANMYLVNLKSPENYVVTVSAPGYITQQESIDLQSATAKKLQVDFNLQPIALGTRVNLKNVLFRQSKAEILSSSFDELNLVVEMMQQNPSMKIKLEGHTDNRGVAKHNLRLSKHRVEAVEDYLVSKGISSNRIKGKGYGGSKPIADNEDPEKRKLNRRVEFTIIKE